MSTVLDRLMSFKGEGTPTNTQSSENNAASSPSSGSQDSFNYKTEESKLGTIFNFNDGSSFSVSDKEEASTYKEIFSIFEDYSKDQKSIKSKTGSLTEFKQAIFNKLRIGDSQVNNTGVYSKSLESLIEEQFKTWTDSDHYGSGYSEGGKDLTTKELTKLAGELFNIQKSGIKKLSENSNTNSQKVENNGGFTFSRKDGGMLNSTTVFTFADGQEFKTYTKYADTYENVLNTFSKYSNNKYDNADKTGTISKNELIAFREEISQYLPIGDVDEGHIGVYVQSIQQLISEKINTYANSDMFNDADSDGGVELTLDELVVMAQEIFNVEHNKFIDK